MKRITVKTTQDLDNLSKAGEVIEDEGIIAYPTDTIYGLGCDPDSEKAVEKIYKVKGRENKNPLIILIDSASRLSEWCSIIPGKALPLILQWPAPLTIILKVKPSIPQFLTRGGDSLGFRVPASNMCRKLIGYCGGSLTSTSVNRSGTPALETADEIVKEFGKEIDLLVEGPSLPIKTSTIINCVDNNFKLVRSGAFNLKKLYVLVQAADQELKSMEEHSDE